MSSGPTGDIASNTLGEGRVAGRDRMRPGYKELTVNNKGNVKAAS